MNIISTVTTAAKTAVKSTKLFVITHKSEIILVGGIGSFVTSEVLACKATLKASKIMDELDTKIEEINDNYLVEDEEGNVIPDQKKIDEEVKKLRNEAKRRIALGYIPALAFMVGGVAGCTASHVILNRELAATSAAYASLSEMYNIYRERVIADQGIEKDREYVSGYKVMTCVDDETGEVAELYKIDDHGPLDSGTSRCFDKVNSKYWTESAAKNHDFLRQQLFYANDTLTTRGYLFFDELLEMLGMTPDNPIDHYIGWVKSSPSARISFGLEDSDDPTKEAFKSGWEASIWLDFNVQGDIRWIFRNNRLTQNGLVLDHEK